MAERLNHRFFGLLIAGSAASGPTQARHARPQPIFRQVQPSDPEVAEQAVWLDRETRFELTRDPKRSVSTIYSHLSDLS